MYQGEIVLEVSKIKDMQQALLEAQRELLLYHENQIRACLKVHHQLVYRDKKFVYYVDF